ncbi:Lcl C-terminal domain-containing protein [Alishewanella longhuensis]
MKSMFLFLSLIVIACNTQLYASTYCQNENKTLPFDHLNSDFIIHGDGTVTHKKTGLIWAQCSLGQSYVNGDCTGEASKHNWQEALIAATQNYLGFSEWRLPNLNELQSLLESRCWSPSINASTFPATPNARYWTATPYLNEEDGAIPSFWYVDFDKGGIGNFYPSTHFQVRLVRDPTGQ